MYDRTWARSVYDAHELMHTRVHQINMCIQQSITLSDGFHPLIAEIVGVLLDSIQGKTRARLWMEYKRLVKRTPLDQALLLTVSQRIKPRVIDDFRQYEFDFTST